MDRPVGTPGKIAVWLGTFLLAGLYVSSLHSYLLFHSITEFFSVVIACGVFMVAWNLRDLLDDNYLLFLGIAFLYVAGLDLLHVLAYKGMGVFPHSDEANLATQLWIAYRYLASISFLIAPLFLDRNLDHRYVFAVYTVVFLALVASIFYWHIFPDCFVAGAGLTTFKKTSEFIISSIFLASAYALYRKRDHFERNVFHFLIASIIVAICAELTFTLYSDVYGIFNLLGHFLVIVSVYLIYKAIIETGLVRPFNLLFRNLKRSEQKLFTVLEELPAFVYLQSSDFHISYANRHFRRVLGTPDGKKCFEILHGTSEPCRECNAFNVLASNRPQIREWIRSENEIYQLYECPFPDILDNRDYVLKLGIDITESKNAEKLLRQAHDELELRVQERTNELRMTNEALQLEIEERQAIEEALRESQEELRILSSRLMVAQEEERKRIAMELHDSIGASLAAVKFGVESVLARNLENLPEPASKSLKAMVPMVQSAVDEVRRMHTGIWPSILDDLGVVAAIQWFCRSYQKSYPHIDVVTKIEINEESVDEPVKIVLYRITQEALNNVAKHSRASRVEIVLSNGGNAIELVIQDDGIGFDPQCRFKEAGSRRGLGLASMKERARLSGGLLEIIATAYTGTTVRAKWPIKLTLSGTDQAV